MPFRFFFIFFLLFQFEECDAWEERVREGVCVRAGFMENGDADSCWKGQNFSLSMYEVTISMTDMPLLFIYSNNRYCPFNNNWDDKTKLIFHPVN